MKKQLKRGLISLALYIGFINTMILKGGELDELEYWCIIIGGFLMVYFLFYKGWIFLNNKDTDL